MNSESPTPKMNPARQRKQNKLSAKGWWAGLATISVLLALLSFARAESRSASGPVKIVLPPETGSFKTAPGSALANAQCLTCHSVEYVSMQPPMPRAFWAASVKKMREKFGANIPEEQIEPLVNYLVENYGADANHKPAVASTTDVKTVPATTPALSDDALATKYGCSSCHGVNTRIVGPPLKDVVAKYRNDPAAIDQILGQIRNGGSGKWGSAIMPPFPMLTDTEARTLANWVMQKGAK